MLIGGLDLETTGLDTATCGITELSAALWDTEKGKLLSMYSTYVAPQNDAPFTYEQNGITRADCVKYGVSLGLALKEAYGRVLRHADAGVAHNWNDFDGPIMRRVWAEYTQLLCLPEIEPKLWIDSSVDIPYPDHITTRKLTYLSTDHGFINPFPHRGLFDTISMLQVVSHYSMEGILELIKSPMIKIFANTPYEEREKPKSRGYRWDKDGKTWSKNIRQCHLERELKEADFEVVVDR